LQALAASVGGPGIEGCGGGMRGEGKTWAPASGRGADGWGRAERGRQLIEDGD